tara:strand:- start:52 stop:762 length:711 start_codon:yes stop_codon:yes gene_type:complete
MAYNQAPLKNIGDIRENIAKRKANRKLGIENQPSAFVEVVREKGFKESISNPRTTKREIQQTRIDRLKATQAAKPKDSNRNFYTMEAYTPEATLENPKPVRQYYNTERTASGGTGDVVSRELSLDYTRKQGNIAAKARGEKSMWRQMRETIKEAKPTFKGRDASKRLKASWKDKAGGTGGRRNVIKNKYGYGFTPSESANQAENSTEGPGNISTSNGRTGQGGLCTQEKSLAGKCN